MLTQKLPFLWSWRKEHYVEKLSLFNHWQESTEHNTCLNLDRSLKMFYNPHFGLFKTAVSLAGLVGPETWTPYSKTRAFTSRLSVNSLPDLQQCRCSLLVTVSSRTRMWQEMSSASSLSSTLSSSVGRDPGRVTLAHSGVLLMNQEAAWVTGRHCLPNNLSHFNCNQHLSISFNLTFTC